MLVGYPASDGDVVVTAVVGPGPNAVHRFHGFEPDAPYHADRVAELYELSGRRHVYLGDWHTHPNGTPYPSRLDRRTLRRIALHPPARAAAPVMLIAGGAGGTWRIVVWQRRAELRLPKTVAMGPRPYSS